MDETKTETIGKTVPAVGKCLAIIRLLDAEAGQGLPLAAIAARLDITKSHCLMILRTLAAEGWVSHDADRQRYSLAAAMLLDLAATIGRHDRGAITHDILTELAGTTGLPCLLSRFNRDGSFTCVDRAQGGAGLLINVPVGHRYPPDAPAQLRARLAAMPAARARAVLMEMTIRPYTAATETDREAIWREVEKARRRGYAVGRMEYLDGIGSIATAIRDPDGRVLLVLQCTGPQTTMEPREEVLGQAILDAASRISVAWGMRGR